ncbi:MAG: hypothetical protein ACKPKO_33100, partial [Candidatus Fonsibacter sp.]
MYSAESPNQFAQTAARTQIGNITTQGTITCQGNLSAQTINATKIICNRFEPTTVNTDMTIKANMVLFGDTFTHTILSGIASDFYTQCNFYQYVRAKNGFESVYDNEYGFSTRVSIKNGNEY